jgi:hypothetical protein
MRQHILGSLLVLGIIFCGIGWVTQYVVPKNASLRAARTCMTKQGIDTTQEEVSSEWKVCLEAAEKEHGTALLAVVGY